MALKKVSCEGMNFDIAYDIINPTAKHDLIILHGWGSNKEIMKQPFSKELSSFRHIYVDLPGFGKSSNEYVLDVRLYAKIIEQFLEVIGAKKFAIAGHSFGGKVATLLNPEHLILLSSAGILEPKPLKVKMKIKMAKVLNFFGLRALSQAFRSKDAESMSENMYKTFKNAVGENLEEDFRAYGGHAMLFWGQDDTATTVFAAKRIDELIDNSELKIYEGDHYFFLKHAHDIGKRIENGIL